MKIQKRMEQTQKYLKTEMQKAGHLQLAQIQLEIFSNPENKANFNKS